MQQKEELGVLIAPVIVLAAAGARPPAVLVPVLQLPHLLPMYLRPLHFLGQIPKVIVPSIKECGA